LLGFTLIAQAVTILDTTWSEEGGARSRAWAGFGAHLRLAARPQFHAVLAFASDDETWGEASGTWIGNDEGHAYILTAAHIYERPAKPGAYAIRSPDGASHHPDRIWVHPQWNGDADTRTGFDLAIVRLPTPLADLGPPPVLYSGHAEAGKLLTFVGFGSRGIGSTGEQERFYHGTDKAAAQGVADQWVDMANPLPRDADGGNYIGVYLPKEDGSIPNPYGGAREPATRLVGLLGSGDSGGSAWMQEQGRWVMVGVNSDGSGTARYGESSWFARIAPHQAWISGIFPGAHFSE
jgi:hypothetical protein